MGGSDVILNGEFMVDELQLGDERKEREGGYLVARIIPSDYVWPAQRHVVGMRCCLLHACKQVRMRCGLTQHLSISKRTHTAIYKREREMTLFIITLLQS